MIHRMVQTQCTTNQIRVIQVMLELKVLLVQLLLLVLMWWWPNLVLWLPGLLGR